MEYDESKTKPSSTRNLLYRQVQEQSELCDVKVKMGHWEMVFHWSVLVASPFFESIYKNGFVERKTGQVNIRIGTPSVLQACLIFFYGKKPKLTDNNISGMLEVAEFLMIPNLKATCIKWLGSLSVTETNCYKLLELASIYEFELSNCTEYIRGHLPEMLQKNEMLNITNDSVEYILSDPTLCYISVEDKFRYLIKWTKAATERYHYFQELFKLIKLEDMSRYFIEMVVKTEPFVMKSSNLDYLQLASIVLNEGEDMQKVFIIDSTPKTLDCLDIERKKFYRVAMEEPEENADYGRTEIKGVKAMACSDVYKVKKAYNHSTEEHEISLLISNLATDQTTKTKVVIMPERVNIRGSPLIIVGNKECFVIVANCEEIPPKSPTHPDVSDDDENDEITPPASLHIMDDIGGGYFLRQSILSEHRNGNTDFDVTTIYKGALQEEITNVFPILALPDLTVQEVCVNKANVLAMLLEDNDTIYLYDQNRCELDKLLLQTNYNLEIGYGDKLAPTTEGFVIFGDQRAICLTRLAGLQSKYKIYLYMFDKENKYNITFRFCENQWFRYYQSYDPGEESTLSYATHDDILATEGGHEINWVLIPLPGDNTTINSNICAMFIPKSKLKCHLNCPHCEQATQSTYTYSHGVYDDDDWCDDSSSGDNYYYGYADDDYYDGDYSSDFNFE